MSKSKKKKAGETGVVESGPPADSTPAPTPSPEPVLQTFALNVGGIFGPMPLTVPATDLAAARKRVIDDFAAHLTPHEG